MTSDSAGQGGAESSTAPIGDRPRAGSVSRVVSSLLRRSDFSVVLATLALFVIFALGSENFLTQYNLFNMGRTAALYVLVAMGQAIVIVTGGMNLSLGTIGGLSVVFAGMAMQDAGLDPVLAFAIALVVGMAAGLFNGLIIVKLKLNSFVATLATSFIFVGLVNGISNPKVDHLDRSALEHHVDLAKRLLAAG